MTVDGASEAATMRVLGLASRAREGAPMREQDSLDVVESGGVDGETGRSPRRGLTLLSRGSWADATADLGVDLPWHVRRANVLVDGLDLLRWVGRRLRVGEVEIEVAGETKPCGLMDEIHCGLKAALVPAGRGGIYGPVRKGGTVRVGDAVEVLDDDAPGDEA